MAKDLSKIEGFYDKLRILIKEKIESLGYKFENDKQYRDFIMNRCEMDAPHRAQNLTNGLPQKVIFKIDGDFKFYWIEQFDIASTEIKFLHPEDFWDKVEDFPEGENPFK